jgi:hypothetical protein
MKSRRLPSAPAQHEGPAARSDRAFFTHISTHNLVVFFRNGAVGESLATSGGVFVYRKNSI